MHDLITLIGQAIFTENLALVFLLGMCTYLAISKRLTTALGLGAAMLVIQTITVPLNNLVFHTLLAPGALDWLGQGELDLSFLKLVVFIGVIAASVQILDIVLLRFASPLHQALGAFLPLLTVNCALLGASLLMAQRQLDLVQSLAYGFGSGFGWALAICLLAALRERLAASNLPGGLQGLGITFIIAGLLALTVAGLGTS
ncbi:MAG: NADH:ubiquinone reductase (Na(+)-transporting) subunit E [Pseudomonadales bacterium]|nr:NADH:ubiquinone reductase (Na(+)-transporting) subunit E [Pseudomonadales bacterium]MCP5184637.1 NADH:ubiquinone reductase (Na(+)-transporting) subunit E [Pseudomonadales bacterium]